MDVHRKYSVRKAGFITQTKMIAVLSPNRLQLLDEHSEQQKEVYQLTDIIQIRPIASQGGQEFQMKFKKGSGNYYCANRSFYLVIS